MRHRYSHSLISVALVAAVVGGILSVSFSRMAGQATRPDRVDGRPNLSGIWQTNNEAN